mmetsp:Transcript_11184/g.26889  ORF Transcript_11184/g.26889 Transcript_11184/m.26889 type:complete len:105 (-) Transcript_11184:5177-5491(-)
MSTKTKQLLSASLVSSNQPFSPFNHTSNPTVHYAMVNLFLLRHQEGLLRVRPAASLVAPEELDDESGVPSSNRRIELFSVDSSRHLRRAVSQQDSTDVFGSYRN